MNAIDIRIQEQDFDFAAEYAQLKARAKGAGAIVLFTGIVRDFNVEGSLSGITLEHYPAMTLKSLTGIAEQACQRWDLQGVTLIHRIGHIQCHEQIVLVGTASQHRASAFEANQFIMDFLKTEAPFWKKEVDVAGKSSWVDGKDSDQRARDRW